jgi:uncharacterized membrane protein YdjX (TVP38/TMEM64 family)
MVHRIKQIRFETWFKWAIGGAILVAALSLIPWPAIFSFFDFDRIIGWVRSTPSNGWTMFIFFCAFSLAILGLPVTIFPIIGGVLFPFWIAFLINMAAEAVGSLLAFGISRFFGREAVETFLRGRMKLLDRFAAHEGLKAVLFVRLSGVPPFVIANYILGLSSVTFRHYVIGTLIGITPWTALMTGLSGFFWQAALTGGQKGLMKAVMETMAPLTVISIVVLTGIAGRAYWKKKKTGTEGSAPASHSNL